MEMGHSRTITKIKSIWRKLESKTFRDVFAAETTSNTLASQLYVFRTQRGMTQADLADLAGMRQSRISNLEQDCHNVTLTTLRRLASALDVALLVKFVPFSELLDESTRQNLDKKILSFHEDSPKFNSMPVGFFSSTSASASNIATRAVTASTGASHSTQLPQLSLGTNEVRYGKNLH
ncbi:helix-turn-helix transcriptional regulator [Pararhodobacter sp. SW119]|uniref:helix-turn-helix domain-containing protein n=1 Tax=Pararhodobacter sp. SW119 TaxID=2780075 RepID=UPI001AE0483B|nr:helix-turn-helix transcriptional regulator [Pararhodobacter sp. SW119]